MSGHAERPFRRRAVQLALATLLLTTLCSRFSLAPSESGSDTFELHMMAGVLDDGGGAVWFGNPLGPFGLYPLSYPIGIPITAAVLAHTTGLDLQTTMTVLGIMMSVLGVLAMFALAYGISKSPGVAMAAAAIFSLTNSYTVQSSAGITGRSAFFSLLPLAILSAWWVVGPVQVRNAGRRPMTALFGALSTVMLATHRLTLFGLPALALALVLYIVVGWARAWWERHRGARRPLLGAAPVAVLGAAFVGSILLIVPGPRQGPSFLVPFLVTVDPTLYAMGWVLETAWNFGPAIVLLPLGVMKIAPRLERPQIRFLFAMLLGEGLLFGSQVPALAYWYFAIPNAICASYGLVLARKWRLPSVRRDAPEVGGGIARASGARAVATILVAVLVIAPSLVIGAYTLNGLLVPHRYADGTSYFLDPETEQLGLYLRHDGNGAPLLVLNTPQSTRLGAVSGDPVLSSLTDVVGRNPHVIENASVSSAFDNPITDFGAFLDYLAAYKTFISISDPLGTGQSLQPWSHYVAATQATSIGHDVREYYHVTVCVETNNLGGLQPDPISRLARGGAYTYYANGLLVAYWIEGL